MKIRKMCTIEKFFVSCFFFSQSKSNSHPNQKPRHYITKLKCVVNPMVATEEETKKSSRVTTLMNGRDSLMIYEALNGLWQTSGGWGHIDRDAAVDAMLMYVDAGLSTFDMVNHYGPAEDLYGIFINKVRRERPPKMLEDIKGNIISKAEGWHNFT